MSPPLKQVQQILGSLSAAEKAQVLKWLESDARTVPPGIESRPEVCGGDPCIAGTRVPVWMLELLRRQGAADGEILLNYPTLSAEDLANAWSFVRSNSSDIERQIDENQVTAAAAQ
jgi:uncharacterized protein (DUF433 family)